MSARRTYRDPDDEVRILVSDLRRQVAEQFNHIVAMEKVLYRISRASKEDDIRILADSVLPVDYRKGKP